MVGIAERRHQRVDIYAQSGDNPWGSPRGAFPDPTMTIAHLAPWAHIVIDNDGHSRLTGFNLATIASEQPDISPPLLVSDEIPWMSPELLSRERHGSGNGHPTKKSDCYALGMVIYEVLGGRAPFATRKPLEVVHMVQDGERPERPGGGVGKLFTDEIWGLLKRCWEANPDDRLGAKGVLMGLEGNPSMSWPVDDSDGAAETDADDTPAVVESQPGVFPFRLTSSQCFFLTCSNRTVNFPWQYG